MVAVKKFFLLCAGMGLAATDLKALAGRAEEPKEIIVVEATQKEDRTIAFLEFVQVGSNDEFDFLQALAPKLMAGEVRKHKAIELPEIDVVPIYPTTVPYDIKVVPMNEDDYTSSTRDLLKQIDAHIENDEVAYVVTNDANKELSYYIKRENVETIDANLDADLSVFTNDEEYMVYTNPEGVRWFVRRRSEPKTPIKVDGKLYAPQNMAFDDLLGGIEADYLVYGTYKPDGEGSLLLNVFVVRKSTQKVFWLGEQSVALDRLQEGLVRSSLMLLGFLQKKPLLDSEVEVHSSPQGAYLYLDGVYMGKTPLVLKELLEGNYEVDVWAPKSTLNKVVDSSSKDDAPSSEGSEGAGNLLLTKETSKDRRIDFEFDTQERKGSLSVSLRGDAWADFYVNTTLAGAQTGAFSTNLNPGQYFLRVSREAYRERWLQVEVFENVQTSITMDFGPPQQSFWSDVVWDHDRNTKIWGSLGFVCLGLYFYVTIQRRSLEDATAPYNASLYPGSEAYFNDLRTRWATYDKWNNRLFYASIVSFTMTMVSRILTIRSEQVPLETMKKSNSDVEIEFLRRGF